MSDLSASRVHHNSLITLRLRLRKAPAGDRYRICLSYDIDNELFSLFKWIETVERAFFTVDVHVHSCAESPQLFSRSRPIGVTIT